MFESLKNIDTMKMQTAIGILCGVVLLFIILLLIFLVNRIKHENLSNAMMKHLPNLAMVAIWILHGCALALILLGGINIYKGNTRYGMLGVFFGLLWFIAMAYSATINIDYYGASYAACLEVTSPFAK